MQGGEVFVPKIPSMSLMGVAEAVAPECEIESIGIRPGEKLHEILLAGPESRHAVELDDMYIIYSYARSQALSEGKPLPDGFEYTSDKNPWKLTLTDLRMMI